jgi:hypothetical protein
VHFRPICPGAGWFHARKRARSSRTGERQDGGAAVQRMRQTRLRRSMGSCRWRTRASEPPDRDRVDTGDLELADAIASSTASSRAKR